MIYTRRVSIMIALRRNNLCLATNGEGKGDEALAAHHSGEAELMRSNAADLNRSDSHAAVAALNLAFDRPPLLFVDHPKAVGPLPLVFMVRLRMLSDRFDDHRLTLHPQLESVKIARVQNQENRLYLRRWITMVRSDLRKCSLSSRGYTKLFAHFYPFVPVRLPRRSSACRAASDKLDSATWYFLACPARTSVRSGSFLPCAHRA